MITTSSGRNYYTQEELNNAKTAINILVEELRQDFTKVAQELLNEADSRDWCDAYNEFVDKINSETKHLKLKYLKKQYEVKVKLEETREQYVYVTIEASSSEDAMELIDNWDYSDLQDHTNSYDWEVTDYDATTIRAESA